MLQILPNNASPSCRICLDVESKEEQVAGECPSEKYLNCFGEQHLVL